MNEQCETNPDYVLLTSEQRKDREIEELRSRLTAAYMRHDELILEKLTIWKVVQRGKYDEELQITDTFTTPHGVVIHVA